MPPPPAELSLPGQPSSVPTARRFVREVLEGWDLPDAAWAAALVVSELSTNVALHARTDFTVSLSRDDEQVRLEVRDGSAARLRPRHYDDASTTGRGLRIVEDLATDWGVQVHDDGKTVWVSLPAQAAPQAVPEEELEPDVDALLAAFDDEPHDLPRHEGVRGVTALRTVRLLALPVDLWATASQRSQELFRELELIAASESTTHPLPARLTEIVATLTATYDGLSTAQEEQLEDAHERGQAVLPELVFAVPDDVSGACRLLGDLLEEADAYCAQGEHLLTLAAQPDVVAFRRWYLGEFVTQLAGRAPVPWPDDDGSWPREP